MPTMGKEPRVRRGGVLRPATAAGLLEGRAGEESHGTSIAPAPCARQPDALRSGPAGRPYGRNGLRSSRPHALSASRYAAVPATRVPRGEDR